MATDPNAEQPLKPLDIRCTRSECGSDLHCFKQTRKMAPHQIGECRTCGTRLVDWGRVQHRDIGDAAFTFESLKYEWIRHHFWHTPIDGDAERHARRKGHVKLRDAAERRIRQSVGGAEPFRDGIQTPKRGNILYYAQHALACCCRSCIEYWHGIPKGRPLSEEEVRYFVELVMRYVEERMPALTEDGEMIPRRPSCGRDGKGDNPDGVH